jgi:CRP-like cAMP-binding protein
VYTSRALAPFGERILSLARPVRFAAGERLVRQGEAARGAFLIVRGELEAQVALPGGGMLAVAELRAGDMLGETALIERGSCSASVLAKSEVEAAFIPRDEFRALVAGRHPAALELQRLLTQLLAAKLRALNAKLREHPAAEDRPSREPPARIDLSRAPAPGFEWRAFLPRLAFFAGFEAEETDALARLGRALELGRGAWLFAAGQPAHAAYLVVRGALDVFSVAGDRERRVAIAGPGELVGYLALLEDSPHAAGARVREAACLLELPAGAFRELYAGDSMASVRLQHAIHAALLRSLARSNNQLTRLIAHARLTAAAAKADELESARRAQLWQADNVNSS